MMVTRAVGLALHQYFEACCCHHSNVASATLSELRLLALSHFGCDDLRRREARLLA